MLKEYTDIESLKENLLTKNEKSNAEHIELQGTPLGKDEAGGDKKQ